jgi:TP901 family phage tail tape measure protein
MNFKASVEVGVNSGKAVGEIDAIVKELQLLNKTVAKAVEELVSLNEKGLKRTATVAKETAAAVKQVNTEAEKTTKAAKGSDVAIRGWNQSMESHYKTLFDVGRVAQSSGRNYLNASTMIDDAIAQRDKSSKQFAKSLKEQMQLEQSQLNSLPRLRYALYDVASSLTAVSAATLGAVAATLTFSAKFETAFTSIERTTMASTGALGLLRQQLIILSTEAPLAFEELAKIATLGSQLGIGTNDLIGFTKVVSQFAATTNVSADEAAKGFGRLGELLGVLPSQYNQLGSAIAFVGVKSAATETEILRTSIGLAGVAKTAGLSTDFIIGLAGSLASLGVPAEQSRGAITRVFQEINRAASRGGPVLDSFAEVLGKTSSEARNLAQSDLQGFFKQLLVGLSGMSSGELTTALDALNLSDIRVTNTLSRLATNVDFTNGLISDSATQFKNGTFLADSYALKVDDLASRFQILQNSLSALFAAVGDSISPFAKNVINFLIEFVNGLTAVAKTPIGQALLIINSTLTIFIGVIAATVAGLAIFGASMAATKTALVTLGVSADGASAAIGRLGKVMKIASGVGIALFLVEVVASLFAVGQAAEDTAAKFNSFVSDTTGLSDAIIADSKLRDEAIAESGASAAGAFIKVGGAASQVSPEIQKLQDQLKSTAELLGTNIPGGYDATNAAIGNNTRYIGENTLAWVKNALIASDSFRELASQELIPFSGNTISDALNDIGLDFDEFTARIIKDGRNGGQLYIRELSDAAQKAGRIDLATKIAIQASSSIGPVSELIDLLRGYGSVVSTIDSSGAAAGIEDVGFSAEFTGKKLTKVVTPINNASAAVRTLTDYANDLSSTFKRAFDLRWASALNADAIADSWENLSKRITDARNRVLGLTATRDKLEYFLSIAIKAGDQLRIADLQAQLANANAELSTATDDASTSLQGNSSAARKNRRELLGIIQSNGDYLSSLAANGASQEKLRRVARQLREDFVNQALAMGYSADEVSKFAKTFGDFTNIINKVPPNVTVDADTNPATQALNEFIAKANSSSAKVKIDYVESDAYKKFKRGEVLNASKLEKLALYESLILAKNYSGAARLAEQIGKIATRLATGNYASGGYTGRGGKYEPAGVVHRGEYVIPKQHVNQSTGLPYADAMGRMLPASAPATSSYANGGLVSGGMMVSLSPDDRALLRGVGASGDIVVAVDSREIARANARGARLVTAEGGYLV